MNETTLRIDLALDPYTATIRVPEMNVSIVSHAAKYLSDEKSKTVHMLRLLAQVLEEGK